MKNTILKRIGLAAMSMALALGAFAPKVQATEITNNSLPPAFANLIIHKYLMEDISNAIKDSNNGLEVATLPEGAVPIDGIEFEIMKINVPVDENGVYTGKTPEKATDVNLATDLDPNFTMVTIKTGVDTAAGLTTETGVASVNLPRGMYYIREVTNEAVSSPAAPFLVSVPMTDPTSPSDRTTWLTNVHVYPKNESSSIAKSVGDPGNGSSSVNTVDSFSWNIDVSVPAKISIADDTDPEIAKLDSNISYKIVDKLDNQLEYTTTQENGDTNASVTVPKIYVITEKNATTNGAEIPQSVSGVDYYTITAPTEANTNTLTFTFTPEGRAYLKSIEAKFIRITFFTKLIEGAATNTPIENGADLNYKNEYDSEEKITSVPPSERPEVHTGKIGIVKVNTNNETELLAGAEFKIALTEQDAKDGKYIKMRDGSDMLARTGADGIATFEGLVYGKDGDKYNEDTNNTTYWIVETKAPDGYSLLDTPIRVQISFVENGTDPAQIDYIAQITVKNSPSLEIQLPNTGGMGTVLFTVGGIVLIGGGIILSILSKKKKTTV